METTIGADKSFLGELFRIFRDDQVAPKASITVRMKKNAVLTETVAIGIKRMVAAAVPRLEAADVVVLDEHGQTVAVTEASVTASEHQASSAFRSSA